MTPISDSPAAFGRMKHLVVILDQTASSFCYYRNSTAADSRLIPMEKLKRIADHAIKHRLSLNCLLGPRALPPDYLELLESVDHVKIVPFRLRDRYNFSIVVIEDADLDQLDALEIDPNRNIIMRIEPSRLKGLSSLFKDLLGKFGRLNLILLDIPGYGHDDFLEYRVQLDKISNLVDGEYNFNHPIEVNVLSDRMLLEGMSNCNAGITHITFAPDGCFYICPGFYYDSELKNNIGDLETGLILKNPNLLELKNAPICAICDAYHCKRCPYLNKKTTGELNTPSKQQCVLSHLERNSSKLLLEDLQHIQSFSEKKPIPEIDYLDPLEVIIKKNHKGKPANRKTRKGIRVADGLKTVELPPLERIEPEPESMELNFKGIRDNKNLEDLAVKELLIKVIKMQEEILRRLK